MALPPFQFPHLDSHQRPQGQEQEQEQRNSECRAFRNLYTLDGELPPPAPFFNAASSSLPSEQAHPPYIPPFHVVGLAPYPVEMNGGEEGGRAVCDPLWNCDLKQPTKRLKEQNFFENNAQLSSADFLQARPVSTGLGLSLDNSTSRAGSSGDSYFLSMLGDEIDRELQIQDAEIDRYLKVQGERLRKVILDKLQADQLQTISYVEDEVLQKLREKEVEVENMNGKNIELEERLEKLAMDAGVWQNRTKDTENMITLLKLNLQQVYAQSRDSKEGCGDSEFADQRKCAWFCFLVSIFAYVKIVKVGLQFVHSVIVLRILPLRFICSTVCLLCIILTFSLYPYFVMQLARQPLSLMWKRCSLGALSFYVGGSCSCRFMLSS
ncbi:hypothetical protein V2J09_023831 [Rumex salicifolius]